MKKNQFTLLAVTFISGITLGLSVIGLYSFTKPETSPALPAAATKISVSVANTLFKNYFQTASPSNSIFKGFELNRDHLTVINSLLAENPGLAGFRIYMGKDNTSGSVGIVVGVNSAGKDVTTSIYQSTAIGSGPCPPICDSNSAITMN